MEQAKERLPQTEAERRARARQARNRYLEHFPREFDFFGFGRVIRLPSAPRPAQLAAAPFLVAVQVSGEEAGLCVVAFAQRPSEADAESMLVELANILASKFVTRLAEESCASIMVSPPIAIEPCSAKQRLLVESLKRSDAETAITSDYEHSGAHGKTRVQLAYLPANRQGGQT